jgi:glycosyltransferase involved in cell wall biosynthesis
MTQRILCSLPALPDRTTGGGVFLYETVLYLLTRGTVHVCLPVARHLGDKFEALTNDPEFAGVQWHPLTQTPSATRFARAYRMLDPTPVEVLKFSTPTNQAILHQARFALAPTAELLISSRAIAPYRNFDLPRQTRLYMMDIDARIVRYDGPSWKRRLVARLEQPKVERLCRKALATAGRVGAISQRDVSELNRMGSRHDVQYVPPLMRPNPAKRSEADSFHVLITTNFSYQPNVDALQWFLQTCWPHVDSRALLTVTGIDADDMLRRLCDEHERVTYAGCLPTSQLDDLFGKVTLAVNPTRTGSGFQIKLLDALARGVPIVSTAFSNHIGAVIPSSDDPMELAHMINDRLRPDVVPPFDYVGFNRRALDAWDDFLFS